jgi:hypothetical protein
MKLSDVKIVRKKTLIWKKLSPSGLVGNSDFRFRFLGPPLEAEFQSCLRFQRFRSEIFSRIPTSGESENWNSDSEIRNSGPHKKSNTNSFVNTKVHGRKPSPYKTAGELCFLPNLHLLIIFTTKPTSTHTLNGKRNDTYSHLTENMSRCGFGAKLCK